MNKPTSLKADAETEFEEPIERVDYDFGLNRRSFVQFLGAGLLIAVGATPALAQRRRGRGAEGARNVSARIHIGEDGVITVLTGKVEAGQGARAELGQAAAEELRVPVDRVQLIMADTAQVPDDGITAGSRSTPSSVPAVRQGAAAARELLVELAAKQWNVEASQIQVQDGKATHASSQDVISYADLASSKDAHERFAQPISSDLTLTKVSEWKVLGAPQRRPNGRDIVTGIHHYPSDINRPGLLYGKVVRPPSYGAKLVSIDLAPAKALKDVVVVQDDQFVGVAAPSSFAAEKALDLLINTAKWESSPHPSSKELFNYLKQQAEGGIPSNPFADQVAQAKQVLRQAYYVAYVQHAPLEPRAAVAEWSDGKLTVWTGTQNPFGCRSELVRAFHLSDDLVRVVVPDFGSGYGGKHTGEVGVEAARLAQAANRPVSLRWTREEEFTWAYFRPAAVIPIEASLDAQNSLTSWFHININSGGSAIDTPYQTGKRKSQFVNSKAPPLRPGSYRALAATANTFARESAMDELAGMAKADPLDFRLAHLDNEEQRGRLRAVLEKATTEFGWREAFKKKEPNRGVGLACGTEKGSYVAACAEIEVDRAQKLIRVLRVCEAFECGAILNPDNLQNQVQGAIIMGLGPALREEMRFENGQMLNASFRGCQVPRFADVPKIDIHLVNRPDLASVGAGETPIIAIAPAIANALFHATEIRVREMPVRIPSSA
ncbi:MAG TPA: molybdopterin cofactor-binding domain-containing protein [Candidatus Limnocylindrales bacterium]|nr:molybdopterin cofactor-binding domain-containing protein [Candidatus Limnocylindrales bacterium]